MRGSPREPVWCPSPPYAMNWYIACEANYCGTTYMSCVGDYSLSCEQCQDASWSRAESLN
jgi:hypothetical protein